MKANYQVMRENQRNCYGKYIPDFEKLIEGASCADEISYIHKVMDEIKMWQSMPGYESFAGFAFNMVYITRQKCGHFEIFQTPLNEFNSLEGILKHAEEHASEYKCSRCVCGR